MGILVRLYLYLYLARDHQIVCWLISGRLTVFILYSIFTWFMGIIGHLFEYCENYRDITLTPLVRHCCCAVSCQTSSAKFISCLRYKGNPLQPAPARLHQPAEAEFHPHHRHQVMADTGTRQQIQGKLAQHTYIYSTIYTSTLSYIYYYLVLYVPNPNSQHCAECMV